MGRPDPGGDEYLHQLVPTYIPTAYVVYLSPCLLPCAAVPFTRRIVVGGGVWRVCKRIEGDMEIGGEREEKRRKNIFLIMRHSCYSVPT